MGGKASNYAYTGLGLVLGIALGLVLWAITGLAIYIVVTLAFGLLIGAAIDQNVGDKHKAGKMH
jgi:hypothetical protein